MIRSQKLIPLTGGAYKSRNAIADFQVCENLFPEINPEAQNPPVPVTHYPREGLRALSLPPAVGFGRGIFTASNGALYACVANTIYAITIDWKWTALGTIQTLKGPISFQDDGTIAIIVDGSGNGYQIILTTNILSVIADTTGTFQGSLRVDYSDTYFAFATPGTNEWIVSNPNSTTFNALQTANKSSKPDPIITFAFNLRVIWLIGATSSEVWWLAGSTPFPYQEFPNVFVPYGCAAPYSLVQADVDLFWISRNEQGQTLAVKTNGYGVESISTRALEYEWLTYPTVADAIGGTFQQAGHTFIIFHFPIADKSWAYDLSTKQWHRRFCIDRNGVQHREKVSFYASVGIQGDYPTTIVGQDWNSGQLYALDPTVGTDNGVPIVCRRTFPHQVADLQEITTSSFVVDFATGGILLNDQQLNPFDRDYQADFNVDFGPDAGAVTLNGPALCMRYSKNGGSTWSEYRQKGFINSGQYRSMMRYRGLGMGRDWIFDVLFVYPGSCALNGAYADQIEHGA